MHCKCLGGGGGGILFNYFIFRKGCFDTEHIVLAYFRMVSSHWQTVAKLEWGGPHKPELPSQDCQCPGCGTAESSGTSVPECWERNSPAD